MANKRQILCKGLVFSLVFILLLMAGCEKKHNDENDAVGNFAEYTIESKNEDMTGADVETESLSGNTKTSEAQKSDEEKDALPDICIDDGGSGENNQSTQNNTTAQDETSGSNHTEKENISSGSKPDTVKESADGESKYDDVQPSREDGDGKNTEEETGQTETSAQGSGIILPDDVFD